MNVGTLTAKLELATGSFEKNLDDAGKKAWEMGKKLSASITAPMAAVGAGIFRMAQAQGAGSQPIEDPKEAVRRVWR